MPVGVEVEVEVKEKVDAKNALERCKVEKIGEGEVPIESSSYDYALEMNEEEEDKMVKRRMATKVLE